MLENLKLTVQMWYDDFMFKYGPERLELARNRLRVHKANIEGRCQFNPYTEPESDWFDYTGD
jgi:hypothetical protein